MIAGLIEKSKTCDGRLCSAIGTLIFSACLNNHGANGTDLFEEAHRLIRNKFGEVVAGNAQDQIRDAYGLLWFKESGVPRRLVASKGWRRKLWAKDWTTLQLRNYGAWEKCEYGTGPYLVMTRHGAGDKDSHKIAVEYDGVDGGEFYFRDYRVWTNRYRPNDTYWTTWWFETKADHDAFCLRYADFLISAEDYLRERGRQQ